LPTTEFWQRRDVWKIAGPLTGVFVFFWLMALDLLVFGTTPVWASAILAGIGPFLFVALLERYLRSRLHRQHTVERRSLAEDEPPATGTGNRRPLPPSMSKGSNRHKKFLDLEG